MTMDIAMTTFSPLSIMMSHILSTSWKGSCKNNKSHQQELTVFLTHRV